MRSKRPIPTSWSFSFRCSTREIWKTEKAGISIRRQYSVKLSASGRLQSAVRPVVRGNKANLDSREHRRRRIVCVCLTVPGKQAFAGGTMAKPGHGTHPRTPPQIFEPPKAFEAG